ncbi:MAG: SDR family oxidoreductase [Promethearchaeota archaeon]
MGKVEFQGKKIIITGGSSGMGKSMARLLAVEGASVSIIARNKDRLEAARAEIEAAKRDENAFIEALQVDVTDESGVSVAMDAYMEQHGVPDVLFNCAGRALPRYIQDFSIDEFREAMEIDYLGTVIPTMKLVPHFIKEGCGHVVNFSSAAGIVGIIGYGTYTPAKFAVIGFSEVLRHELKPRGITVSVVCPSDVNTPGFEKENETKPEECKIISEHSKVMEPDDIARDILNGVKKQKFMILPGESGFVSTMKRLFPGLVFKTIDKDLQKARKKLGKL